MRRAARTFARFSSSGISAPSYTAAAAVAAT